MNDRNQSENQKNQPDRKGKRKASRRAREPKWDKLDNTAHLFPVIAGDDMTNVYRISVVLKEPVIGSTLQRALDMVDRKSVV